MQLLLKRNPDHEQRAKAIVHRDRRMQEYQLIEAEMLHAIYDQNVMMVDILCEQFLKKKIKVYVAAEVVHHFSVNTDYEEEERNWRADLERKYEDLMHKWDVMVADHIESLLQNRERKPNNTTQGPFKNQNALPLTDESEKCFE